MRNIDQAMASLNKIISNPGMKINKADKDAIINAWRSLNANDMADKLGNLARAFKAVDVVQKVEKIRQKSIEGFETGNWQPLMLEVESWVLSGLAASFALGILTSIITSLSSTLSLITAVTILGIILFSVAATLIDDKLVDKINNELIRPAY
nr:colicin-like pore-forming protein [Erwinia mallotivora]